MGWGRTGEGLSFEQIGPDAKGGGNPSENQTLHDRCTSPLDCAEKQKVKKSGRQTMGQKSDRLLSLTDFLVN